MIAQHAAAIQQALAVGGDEYSLDDVLDLVEAGEAQLWKQEGAVIVTELIETPRAGLTVHFWLAGGELESVLDLHRKVIEWAKHMGCTRATMTGRKGWTKALRTEGWTYEAAMMGKTL